MTEVPECEEDRDGRENRPPQRAGKAASSGRPGEIPEVARGRPGAVGRWMVAPPRRTPQGDSVLIRLYSPGVSRRSPDGAAQNG